MPVPDKWAQVWFRFNGGSHGGISANIHWFKIYGDLVTNWTDGGFIAPVIASLDAWAQVAYGFYPYYLNDVNLPQCNLWIAEGSVGRVFVASLPLGIADGKFSVAGSACAVIQRFTDTPGRRGRGRFFHGCLSPIWINGDMLSPTGSTALQAITIALLTPIDLTASIGVTLIPSLYSYTDQVLLPITGYSVNLHLGTRLKRQRPRFFGPDMSPRFP